jgi:hypothetical protein
LPQDARALELDFKCGANNRSVKSGWPGMRALQRKVTVLSVTKEIADFKQNFAASMKSRITSKPFTFLLFSSAEFIKTL